MSLSSLAIIQKNDFWKKCDYFEFRFDEFRQDDWEIFETIRSERPWIAKTLDSATLQKVLSYRPSIVDLDFLTQLDLLHKIDTPVILSHHLQGGLIDVQNDYDKMIQHSADYYKIVVVPNDMIEALKIVLFFRTIPHKNWICFCMGTPFAFTRFFGLIDHHPFIYTGLKGYTTAKGQLTIEELENYSLNYLNPKIFCLIGDPVSKSVSHAVYNAYFSKKNIDAIYLKIPLKKEEFQEGISLLEKIGIKGISITTPLKNAHRSSSPYHPVNTIVFEDEPKTLNTDLMALIELLEKKVELKGCKILLLGCGAIAKGFAKELIQRGAIVAIENRTKEKIQEIAKELPIETGSIEKDYAVIIQASSSSTINWSRLKPKQIVVECVVDPIFTTLVKKGIQQDVDCILGYEFFFYQGKLQLDQFLPQVDHMDFFSLSHFVAIKELLYRS